MTTKLDHFIQRARGNPNHLHTSLMGLLFEEEGLRESYQSLDGRKALGVDGVSKEEYGENLDENIQDLSARLKRLGYRPKPVRRVFIPKANGGKRPLGVPCFECKIVQDRLARILMGIWEPQFLDSSYGYRPDRGAHDALRELDRIIFRERTQFIVEADIKGFFGAMSHDHMVKFLQHRINDPKFIRTIQRFLKAGVVEDGQFHASEQGSPQGGLVSPVLSNVYLHYVLDIWFEKRFKKTCRGKAYLIRYCDDFVACFTDKGDAVRFNQELVERLRAFALEIEPTKTKLIPFGSNQFGKKGAATFSFLGFTHCIGKTRAGRFKVIRRTDGKRFRLKLKILKGRLRGLRVVGGAAMVEFVRRHLTGHYQYYGVSENADRIVAYYYHAAGILFKWLNRRSQRPSITWERFQTLMRAGLLPKPRIKHSFY